MSKDGIWGLKDVFTKRDFQDWHSLHVAFRPEFNVVSVSICFLKEETSKSVFINFSILFRNKI